MSNLRFFRADTYSISEGISTLENNLISVCVDTSYWSDEEALVFKDNGDNFFVLESGDIVFDPSRNGKISLESFKNLALSSPTESITIYDLNNHKVLAGPLDDEDNSLVYDDKGNITLQHEEIAIEY